MKGAGLADGMRAMCCGMWDGMWDCGLWCQLPDRLHVLRHVSLLCGAARCPI